MVKFNHMNYIGVGYHIPILYHNIITTWTLIYIWKMKNVKTFFFRNDDSQ